MGLGEVKLGNCFKFYRNIGIYSKVRLFWGRGNEANDKKFERIILVWVQGLTSGK